MIIENDTFRSYTGKIKDIYDNWIKVTGEGTSVTLSPTRKGKMQVGVKGNTEQTQLTGKNLFNIDDTISQGTLEKYNNGFKLIKGTNRIVQFTLGKIVPAGTYTLSADVINSSLSNLSSLYVAYKKENGTNILTSQFLVNGTVTLTEDCYKLYFYILNTESDSAEITIDNVILNSGSTAKTFEEYCGGVPSPNPDYPQNIKVATGSNTINIGSSFYSVNLGSIELWGIGNYKDSIIKENGKWYLRKAIGKYVYDNDLSSNGINAYSVNMLTPVLNIEANAQTKDIAICNMLQNQLVNYTGLGGTTSLKRIRVNMSLSYAMTYDEAKAIYSANNLTIYYVKEIAEDTEITDTDLIAQLEALLNTHSSDNTTTITSTYAEGNAPLIITASALKKGGN